MPPGASSPNGLKLAQTESPSTVKGAITIDAVKAKALYDNGVPFVDVREQDDWVTGHIPGAVHLELHNDFSEAKLAEVVSRHEEVVILARGVSFPEPAIACSRAVSWGFRKVYYFREGYPGWKSAGFPISFPPG